jgi:hypothetical protein
MHTLSETLGCGRLHLGNMYSLIDQISLEKMQAFAKGGWVVQDHLAPSLENMQILQHFGCSMVLHVRDPRQAMVSWLHHLDRVYRKQGEEPLLLVAPRPPAGYFTWDFADKIDWQIDHYLLLVIDWLVRWLAIHGSGEVPILLTDYRELSGDAGRLCRRICGFYGIAADSLRLSTSRRRWTTISGSPTTKNGYATSTRRRSSASMRCCLRNWLVALVGCTPSRVMSGQLHIRQRPTEAPSRLMPSRYRRDNHQAF